jgi:hypothetical protein
MPDLIGHRVILAWSLRRSRKALGTVISDHDVHPDRGLVLVRHEDGYDRWRRPATLRVLGDPGVPASSLEALAWDLWLRPAGFTDPRIVEIHDRWRATTAEPDNAQRPGPAR